MARAAMTSSIAQMRSRTTRGRPRVTRAVAVSILTLEGSMPNAFDATAIRKTLASMSIVVPSNTTAVKFSPKTYMTGQEQKAFLSTTVPQK